MQTIRLAGVGNIPNLRRLRIVDADAVMEVYSPASFVHPVVTLPDTQQVEIMDIPLALDEAKSELYDVGFDLWFVPGDGVFSQKRIAGIYDTVLTIPISGDFALAADTEFKLGNRRWIGITEDNNGLPRLVGTKKQPLRFESGYDSGSRSRTFVFRALTKHQAYYLQSSALETDAGFSKGFSLGFNS